MINKSIIIGLIFMITGLGSMAQNQPVAAGGTAVGSGGSISYSVGQVFYNTNFGSNGAAAQGVQQPFEISVVTNTEEAIGIDLFVAAYPNPTTDYLTLKVENFEPANLRFQLFDINGRILENREITENETTIIMSSYVQAVYFLRVINGNKEIKSFKIVKN